MSLSDTSGQVETNPIESARCSGTRIELQLTRVMETFGRTGSRGHALAEDRKGSAREKTPANATELRLDSVREMAELVCHQEKSLCQEDGKIWKSWMDYDFDGSCHSLRKDLKRVFKLS